MPPKNHQIAIVSVVAVVAGFYLANATTGTGIYANSFFGQSLANIYIAGNKLGGNVAPAATGVTPPATPPAT